MHSHARGLWYHLRNEVDKPILSDHIPLVDRESAYDPVDCHGEYIVFDELDTDTDVGLLPELDYFLTGSAASDDTSDSSSPPVPDDDRLVCSSGNEPLVIDPVSSDLKAIVDSRHGAYAMQVTRQSPLNLPAVLLAPYLYSAKIVRARNKYVLLLEVSQTRYRLARQDKRWSAILQVPHADSTGQEG